MTVRALGVQRLCLCVMAKKASGRNVTDDERNTERVTLRLDPESMALLRYYAAAWHCPMAEVVSCALEALEKKPL